jgi:hypothetical protein
MRCSAGSRHELADVQPTGMGYRTAAPQFSQKTLRRGSSRRRFTTTMNSGAHGSTSPSTNHAHALSPFLRARYAVVPAGVMTMTTTRSSHATIAAVSPFTRERSHACWKRVSEARNRGDPHPRSRRNLDGAANLKMSRPAYAWLRGPCPAARVPTHMMSAWASRDRLDPQSRRIPRPQAGLLCLTPGPAREYGAAARLA